MSEWLGAFVDHCVVKLLGGIMQCRVARHCRSLGGMARGHEHGPYCQAAHCELVSTSYLVALCRQSRRAVTARDLGSSSHTVAELLGGCLLCDVDVSAGVFTLVDFYLHFAGLQPACEEAQQQAAAAGSLRLRGAGHTTGGRG